MSHSEISDESAVIHLKKFQEKRNLDDHRMSVMIDFDFYVRPLDPPNPISRNEKHSANITEISSKGFSFLYPAKPSLETEYDRSGCISKNVILDIYLYFEERRFRFNAIRVWAKPIIINDTTSFQYGAKWLYPNANQEVALKFILDSLKNSLQKALGD